MASTGLECLPAADPFRFRTDAFDGQSRQVLFTEDFESMNVGDNGRTIGPWRTEYAAGREQHIIVVDPSALGTGDSSPPVLPPLGRRAMEFANTVKVKGKQGRQLNAMLWRELDGKNLPARCKLLVECDISPRTSMVEPSLSLTHDYPLRLAPGLALSEEADPAAAKLEWRPDQWYRIRAVWNVEQGAPRGATVERLQWRGADGWFRDASVQLPAPKRVSDPMAQLRFGFPAPITGKAGGTYWLDNVKVEVLEEK